MCGLYTSTMPVILATRQNTSEMSGRYSRYKGTYHYAVVPYFTTKLCAQGRVQVYVGRTFRKRRAHRTSRDASSLLVGVWGEPGLPLRLDGLFRGEISMFACRALALIAPL